MARVIVVDASCLYAVVAGGREAESVRKRLAADDDHAAPHVIDVEVLNIIRRERMRETLDETAASLALDDLRSWPGERYWHRALLERSYELRHNIRGWDAVYVALAEALDAPLITLDDRLAGAAGPRCTIERVLNE